MIKVLVLQNRPLTIGRHVKSTSFAPYFPETATYYRTGVSAQRSRAAAGASVWKASNTKLTRSAKRNLKKRHHAKKNKQENRLLCIKSTEKSVRLGRNFPEAYLEENVVVFDGGIQCETANRLYSSVLELNSLLSIFERSN